MSQILPEGEAIRKAAKWIVERRQEEGCPPVYRLIEEASMKFNLSPSDQEFLGRFFRKKEGQ